MKILRADRKKINLCGLLLSIVTLLSLFDILVLMDDCESQNAGFYVRKIALEPKMGKPQSENKGMNTPPVSSQQASKKNAGTKPPTSGTGSGKNNPSSTATTNVTSNAHQTLFMNNNHGANTIPGTMSESQYTSQLQFSAPHDKQNDSNSATTSTTMNSSTCPNFGYMTIAPPQVIMNNGGPIDVMGPMNPMNPMNSAHYMNNVSPMNTNNGIQGVSDTTPMNPMNPLKFNQGIYANTVPDGNMAPPWAAQFFQGLDLRLNQIELQISNQNARWQHIEDTLENQNHTLQSQNTRIVSIENQMSEMNLLKTNVSRVETKVQLLNSDIQNSSKQLQDYQTSIESFSDFCDVVTKDNQSYESKYMDLLERVGSLEFEHSKLENTVVDLQCRSMRDNLIFTGIDEVESEGDDDYENVEQTLVKFLETEMNIRMHIGFHRVHRLGRLDKTSVEPRPRPIIAKFEKFKDREFVRSKAPQTLRSKNFGVREQFPKVIEDQRKLLYPEAKKARQNERNKVRMVRDKLYVNNSEVVVQPKAPLSGDGSTEARRARQSHSYRRENTQSDLNIGYRGNRVFYRGGKKNYVPRPSERSRTVDFSVPITNRYATLADYVNTPVQGRSDQPGSKKHPASSPLDEELHAHKKQRDGQNSESDSSEMAVSSQDEISPKTPVKEDGSSGNAALSEEKNFSQNTPVSVNSTVTVMPNLEWSATSPDNNLENRQVECGQSEA